MSGLNMAPMRKENMAHFLCKVNIEDLTEVLLDANSKCLELFECNSIADLREYCQGNMMNAVYEEDHERITKQRNEIYLNDDYFMQHSVFRIVALDGQIKWVEAYTNLNVNSDQELVYHMFIIDITDRLGEVQTASRVDVAIDEYNVSLYSREESWDALAQQLLDKARDIMGVDCVYIMQAFNKMTTYVIDYASANRSASFIKGFECTPKQKHSALELRREHFDTYGVAQYPYDIKGHDVSVLSYGLFTGKDFIGTLSFADTKNPNREWSIEERNSIIHLGRALHQYVQNLQNKRIKKALQQEQRKLEKHLKDLDLVNALCAQYSDVFRIDLKKDSIKPLRYKGVYNRNLDIFEITTVDSYEGLTKYLSSGMPTDEKLRLKNLLTVENIQMRLWDDNNFIETFYKLDEYGESYFELKVVAIGEPPYSEIVLGIVDVTDTKLIEIENKKNSRMVEALSDDYTAIFYVDAKSHTVRMYRADTEVASRYGKMFEEKVSYDDVCKLFVDHEMDIDPSDEIYKYTDFDEIVAELQKTKMFTVNYKRVLDGEARQFKLKIVGVEQEGEIVGAVLGFADIENEYRRELEYQALLRDALEEAKHASASKTNFLFNMSHDIRTPMNAILGFSALAEKDIKDHNKMIDYLHKINVSGQHLLSLINDVLDMARIESGKIELHEEPFDVTEHFNSTVDMFKLDMDNKNIDFQYKLDVRDNNVEADALRVKQIELNLLGNALKYTKEGGSVYFEVTQMPDTDKEYATYKILVRDTGIGMSSEFQKHVFDLFEREKRASVTGIQGTGLGLAITKRLTELMNGTISCRSVLGKGTEFVCVIRARLSDPNVVVEEEELIDLSVLEGKRVLLVEDNDLNREIARAILEEVGLYVEEATDGTIAVDMMNKDSADRFDVVLMDIQMPYMDGYKATRIIRNAEKKTNRHVPIIAMTANAFDEDKKKAFEAGMDAHLGKPVKVENLYRELVRLS